MRKSHDEIYAALEACALMVSGARPQLIPLQGGVSSDIFRVDLPERSICVKRALQQLKVEQEWFAPVERSEAEVLWIRTVEMIYPSAAPPLIAADSRRHLFVMVYLDPVDFPCWKNSLRDGTIEQAGYQPGEDVWICLDIAANEFGRDGRYQLALDDREIGAARRMTRIGQRVQIIGDDLLVTEAKEAFDAARAAGWGTIVSARSGESEDVMIAHLAVGWDAGQFKVGSFAGSDGLPVPVRHRSGHQT